MARVEGVSRERETVFLRPEAKRDETETARARATRGAAASIPELFKEPQAAQVRKAGVKVT